MIYRVVILRESMFRKKIRNLPHLIKFLFSPLHNSISLPAGSLKAATHIPVWGDVIRFQSVWLILSNLMGRREKKNQRSVSQLFLKALMEDKPELKLG